MNAHGNLDGVFNQSFHGQAELKSGSKQSSAGGGQSSVQSQSKPYRSSGSTKLVGGSGQGQNVKKSGF